jgi:hypothetical protein
MRCSQSDRGVQYAAHAFPGLFERHGIHCSMSRKGNCYDNAVKESFFHTLKTELCDREHYRARAQARASVFEFIEVLYNRQRLHSTLGYCSPAEFEAPRGASLSAASPALPGDSLGSPISLRGKTGEGRPFPRPLPRLTVLLEPRSTPLSLTPPSTEPGEGHPLSLRPVPARTTRRAA